MRICCQSNAYYTQYNRRAEWVYSINNSHTTYLTPVGQHACMWSSVYLNYYSPSYHYIFGACRPECMRWKNDAISNYAHNSNLKWCIRVRLQLVDGEKSLNVIQEGEWGSIIELGFPLVAFNAVDWFASVISVAAYMADVTLDLEWILLNESCVLLDESCSICVQRISWKGRHTGGLWGWKTM